jgi:alanine racemase
MHRLGFLPSEVAPAYAQLSQIPGIASIGFMTHLASADTLDDPHTREQIDLFNQLVTWEGARSVAHSAAILAWPETRLDLIRPGIMLYGISPFANRIGADFGLKPVMSLSARLVAIKPLKKGETVGYSNTWSCPEDLVMGIASIGYGDGYPRHAKNGTPVLVNGKRCALAGRVSMDFINIDLRNAPDAAIGDTVLVWGEGLPVEEIAQWAETSAYELTTKITPRAVFEFV